MSSLLLFLSDTDVVKASSLLLFINDPDLVVMWWQTNQELMSTKQRQAKTEQKSTEAMTKAETERGHIRRELDSVRDNLTQIR